MLLFKHGGLTSDQQRWAQDLLNKYPYAILLSGVPDFEWSEKNLTLFDDVGEDCMGGSYNKKTQMWGTFNTSFGHLFFYKCKEDYDKIAALPIVIDRQPFQTILGQDESQARH